MSGSESNWVSRANYNALKEEIAGLNKYIKKLREAAHSTSDQQTQPAIPLSVVKGKLGDWFGQSCSEAVGNLLDEYVKQQAGA